MTGAAQICAKSLVLRGSLQARSNRLTYSKLLSLETIVEIFKSIRAAAVYFTAINFSHNSSDSLAPSSDSHSATAKVNSFATCQCFTNIALKSLFTAITERRPEQHLPPLLAIRYGQERPT